MMLFTGKAIIKDPRGKAPRYFIGARFARALRPRGAWYLPILAPQLKNEKEYFLLFFVQDANLVIRLRR